ncbi:MAG TPA: hypothetical protein VFJ10_13800 [Acidobacteriaceae bacterium]|nr:hypothetical protein [Acidobacteriaceae bacterium]
MIDELFDGLNRLASSTSVPAGTLLFRRDAPSSAFTSSAVARSLCSGRRRKRRIPWKLSLRGASSAFVLPSMGTYSSTAKALTDSELGFISSDRVLEALASKPALWRAAMRIMSQEVARMRSSIAEHCIHIAE